MDILQSTKWSLAFAVVPLVLAVAILYGITFSSHSLNILAIFLAYVCIFFLSIRCFKIRPKYFGIFVGVLAMVIVFSIGVFLAFNLIVDNTNPTIAEIGNSRYCTKYTYGFVTTDSGTQFDAYKRYGFIDKKIASYRDSDVYPGSNHKDGAQTIELCQEALNGKK